MNSIAVALLMDERDHNLTKIPTTTKTTTVTRTAIPIATATAAPATSTSTWAIAFVYYSMPTGLPRIVWCVFRFVARYMHWVFWFLHLFLPLIVNARGLCLYYTFNTHKKKNVERLWIVNSANDNHMFFVLYIFIGWGFVPPYHTISVYFNSLSLAWCASVDQTDRRSRQEMFNVDQIVLYQMHCINRM